MLQVSIPASSGQSAAGVKPRPALARLLWWPFWLTLLLVGLLLANWQWQRADEKQRLDQALASAPLLFNPAQLPPNLAELQLQGQWLAERTLWLDNRIHQGRIGVAALTPLLTADGRWWLVQRGFVATGVDRSQLPQLITPTGPVSLTGRWQLLEQQRALVFGDNREGDRLQSINLQPWADLPGPVFAGVVHQTAGDGLLQPWWQPSQMTAARHQGYALQWLLLSALALCMALVGWRWMKEKRA